MHILEISMLCAEMRTFIYSPVLQDLTVYILCVLPFEGSCVYLVQMLKRRPPADRAYCIYCAIAYGVMPVCYICEPFLEFL